MQAQTKQQIVKATVPATVRHTCPKHTTKPGGEVSEYSVPAMSCRQDAPPPLFTVAQFAERNSAFTSAAVRNLIFKADERQSSNGAIPGNGLIECGAILRVGRKVLINEERFFNWVEAQNRGA